jgi:hypothetical protein
MSREYQVVCRVAPVKNMYAVRGCHLHNKRLVPGTANKPMTHDPARTHLNECLVGNDDVQIAVGDLLKEYKKAHADSTIAGEIVLSANQEWFDEICPKWRDGIYTKAFLEWKELSLKWLKQYPGLASVNLHMDEQAPHFQALILPLETKERRFRRGSKIETKIRYNAVFGDDMSVILEAQRTGNSELTKCGRMQTSYADAMKPTGLQRGIMNSPVFHTTIAEHHKLVSKPTPEQSVVKSKRPKATKTEKILDLVGIQNEFTSKLAAHQAEVNRVHAENAKVLKQMGAKAKELDKTMEKLEKFQAALIKKDEELKVKGAELRKTKSTVDRLRGIPLEDVAERILYEGDVTWKNAIDMVKDVGGLDYEEAVAWLYNEFGESATLGTVGHKAISNAKCITDVKPAKPTTVAENEVRNALGSQLNALDADRYRVTLMAPPGAAIQTYNMGKGKDEDGAELFYSHAQLTALVPTLRRENARGYNVFITPYSDTKNYLLVDDLTNESLPRFQAAGYAPTILQTTSKDKMQAVFALPKEDVPEPVRNALFNELNQEYGDKKITGYTHPFRAAGFMNRKPEYAKQKDGRTLYPIVRVMARVKAACSAALAWARQYLASADIAHAPAASNAATEAVFHQHLDLSLEPSARASREAAHFFAWINEKYGGQPGGPDYSKADFMLSQRMRAGGFSESDIAATLWAHSPGIEDRHADVMRYVNTTVAQSTIKP